MIGLKRGTVKLVLHHKSWSVAFEEEKEKILKKACGLIVDVQHVGSTAVLGMHAKPIIDMDAGVARFKDADRLVAPLRALGYKFYRKFGTQILFAKGPDEKRTHYLHVMRYGGIKWKRDLLFRDYLRDNTRVAKEYEQLKQKLAKLHPNERDKYTAGKKKYIDEIIKEAKKHRSL